MNFVFIDSGSCNDGSHICELREFERLQDAMAYIKKMRREIEHDATIRLIVSGVEMEAK